ncbi:hypothetical protein EPI10_016320 [Gossypium australe]|uniref:Uncharacterized protein n=1 Tax=Gossypium australe TaxID=47621 RepID=A0A5B6VN97_9ROSI|nr:hypothetical protein EPI10_016320 [Gossypium australe]
MLPTPIHFPLNAPQIEEMITLHRPLCKIGNTPAHIGAHPCFQAFISQQISHSITPAKEMPKVTPVKISCLMFEVSDIRAEDRQIKLGRLDLMKYHEGVAFNNHIWEIKSQAQVDRMKTSSGLNYKNRRQHPFGGRHRSAPIGRPRSFTYATSNSRRVKLNNVKQPILQECLRKLTRPGYVQVHPDTSNGGTVTEMCSKVSTAAKHRGKQASEHSRRLYRLEKLGMKLQNIHHVAGDPRIVTDSDTRAYTHTLP